MRIATLLLIAALPLAAAAAPPRTFPATVTHVTDGDTLWVRPASGGAGVQLRVKDVDAPESCQPFGARSRESLQQLLLHRPVTVERLGRDDYGRMLARVRWSGQDVGAWLVFNGLAWSYRWRREAGPYAALESQARQARRGLWAQAQPMEPRRFRRLHGRCPLPGQ